MGIGRVGAGGDGGDGDVAMLERPLHARHLRRHRLARAKRGEGLAEPLGRARYRHEALRPRGARKAGLHVAKIEFQHALEGRLGVTPHALRLRVTLDEVDLCGIAPGLAQIGERLPIDRKESHGGAIFGGHVGDGGPIRQGEAVEGGTAEFHHGRQHIRAAQEFRQRQNNVRAHDANAGRADKAASHDARGRQSHGLPEYGGRRFDPPDAPAEDAEPVHHGRMAVHAHETVWIGQTAPVLLIADHDLGEALDVDLVHDAVARGHDAEIAELRHGPAHDAEALAIAFEFGAQVARQGVSGSGEIRTHRMIDHQIGRHDRIDPAGIATTRHHGVAHGGKIHQQRHARRIRHQHARWMKGYFPAQRCGLRPMGEGGHILARDRDAILMAQQVFEQNLQ